MLLLTSVGVVADGGGVGVGVVLGPGLRAVHLGGAGAGPGPAWPHRTDDFGLW